MWTTLVAADLAREHRRDARARRPRRYERRSTARQITYPPREAPAVTSRDEPPDAVIWSTGTPSIASDLELARRDQGGRAVDANGGIRYPRHRARRRVSREDTGLDAIIRNEPEATASEWVSASRRSRPRGASIRGLSYRQRRPHRAEPRPPVSSPISTTSQNPAWQHCSTLDAYRLAAQRDEVLDGDPAPRLSRTRAAIAPHRRTTARSSGGARSSGYVTRSKRERRRARRARALLLVGYVHHRQAAT